jgi:hypothetical protein
MVLAISLLTALLVSVRGSWRSRAKGCPCPSSPAEDDVLLGFPTTIIGPGATAQVFSCTQVDLRIRRLVIPSDIAGSLLVNDVNVTREGTDVRESLLANTSPVPGRVFTELASVGLRRSVPLVPGQSVHLNVTNMSGGAIPFNAVILGTRSSEDRKS